MAAATLLELDAGLPGGLINGSGNTQHARTLAFTTLVLLQVFNIFNSRSDEQSAFVNLFQNHWLWIAVGVAIPNVQRHERRNPTRSIPNKAGWAAGNDLDRFEQSPTILYATA